MGSEKSLNGFTKFLIYLGVILGAVLVIVLICFAVMFFVPGTSILGYEYVKYSNSTEHKFTTETSLSIADITAFEVVTESTDIYIYPNQQANEIKIIHKEGMSGFAKSIDVVHGVTSQIISKSFDGNNTELKTLIFNVDEPRGLMSTNFSSVVVYLPSNIYLNTISAKSSGGKISYSSKSTKKNETEVISCSNLYLKTSGAGNVNITNDQDISNYYISTYYGSLFFSDIEELSANKIVYETGSGAFEYTNKAGDATINVRDELFIKSNRQVGIGPQIRVNNLNGNLKVETFNGYYHFYKIGEEGNNKTVAITTNNSRINLDTVYGQVSILSNGDKISNTIDIENLYGGNGVNNLDAGEGNIKVNLLNGDTALNTTSGHINVGNASNDSSIWAHSTSGNINITYSASEKSNNTNKTTVLTNSGNVNLKNVSNAVNIHMLSSDIRTNLNLTFTAIASTDNVINAGNRNVFITYVGSSDALQHRIASTTAVDIVQTAGVSCSEIKSSDADTLRNNVKYKDYLFNYRVGYPESNNTTRPYDSWGKMLINTTGSITLRTITGL